MVLLMCCQFDIKDIRYKKKETKESEITETGRARLERLTTLTKMFSFESSFLICILFLLYQCHDLHFNTVVIA